MPKTFASNYRAKNGQNLDRPSFGKALPVHGASARGSGL
jgi:hypothetical protein